MARIALIVLLLVGSALPVAAHSLRVFASQIGDTVTGRVYFVGGGPGRDVAITVTAPNGTVLAQTRTDAETGEFSVSVPPAAQLVVMADAQDGHVARFTLGEASSSTPATPVSTPATPGLETALARQIAPLAAQIDALRAETRLRDVIGGIGYIVGLFGLWAFWRARSRPQ